MIPRTGMIPVVPTDRRRPSDSLSWHHCTSASGRFVAKPPIQRLFRRTVKLALQSSDLSWHVHSHGGTHASLFATQARSKQGRTLRTSCVVSSVITSRPLRHPSVLNAHLAGLIQLDRRLPPSKLVETMGLQVRFSVVSLRMPLALPRVPCRCSCPLLPCRHWPSP
jgi:hypothetical protein